MIPAAVKKIDRFIFGRLQDQVPQVLSREIVGSCQTLLDLGCGANSPIRQLTHKLQYSVGVDAFEPAIENSKAARIHNEYRLMNVLDIDREFEANSFDCVLAYDIIEHLSKEDGLRLVAMMETITRRKVIIYTPNGFLPRSPYHGNIYQTHLSGWEIEELQDLGYRVIGIHGWKPLRGEWARIRWHPRFFWRRISFLTQLITTSNPKYAFQILGIKDLRNERHGHSRPTESVAQP